VVKVTGDPDHMIRDTGDPTEHCIL
jgi:hypothetical protein